MDLAKTLKTFFHKLDVNGDGVLSHEELANFLRTQNPSWTDAEFQTLFKVVDSNNDGKISINEFIDWSLSANKKEDKEDVVPQELRSNAELLRSLKNYLDTVISKDQWFTDPVNMERLDICKQAVQTKVEMIFALEAATEEETDADSKLRNAKLWDVAKSILPGLDLSSQRRIALIGLAGSGKSTLAKQLSVLFAKTCLSSLTDPEQIFAVPLKIPLTEICHLMEKGVEPSDLLEKWILSRFGENHRQLEMMMLCYREGHLLIYLDGLDETAGHLGEVKQWLADWVQDEVAAKQHIFIVSMRPSAYAPQYFKRLNFQTVVVTPLTRDLARQLVRQRLEVMELAEDAIESMQEQVTRPEFSCLMEVPLLCTLLIHVLLKRGFAGPEQTLQYIAREVLRQFDEDIADIIGGLEKPLRESFALYEDACRQLRKSEEEAFGSLIGMPSVEVPDAEWDELEQEVDLSDLNEKETAYAQVALHRILEHAQKAQQKVKKMIAPDTEWAAATGDPDKPLKIARSTESKLAAWIDGAVDPGIKGKSDGGERIWEKCRHALPRLQAKGVARQLPDAFKRCFDLSRFSFVYDSLSQLLRGAKEIALAFDVVCMSNRFKRPTALGYRDMCLVIRVKLEDGTTHLAEVQLQLGPLLEAKEKGHGYYETIRKALPAGKVQQFIMDRLSGRNRERITQVGVGQEALALMLDRMKGSIAGSSGGLDSSDLRQILRSVAWSVHTRRTRVVTEERIRHAAPSPSMGDALWTAVKSGEVGLLDPIPHSDELQFQFFHLSFQTLLVAEYLADKVRLARKDPQEAEALFELDSCFQSDWWSKVFLNTYEVLMGEAGGSIVIQWWIDSLGKREDEGREDRTEAMKVLFHAAAEDEQVVLMQTLVRATDGKVHPDALDWRGLSPLMKAAVSGDIEVIKGLLELNANPETRCRFSPELELLRGTVEDLKSEECRFQAGSLETHRFLLGLPTAILPGFGSKIRGRKSRKSSSNQESTPRNASENGWMFEIEVQETPSIKRSVQAVDFTKGYSTSTTTYHVDWQEVAVGWMQVSKLTRAKHLAAENLLGRNSFSVSCGGDGICRHNADGFHREMKMHCNGTDVTGATMKRYGSADVTEMEPPPKMPELEDEGTSLQGSWKAGDIIGVAAMPGEAGWRFWFAQNGEWQEAETVSDMHGDLIPVLSGSQCGGRFRTNFGQQAFAHLPPTSIGKFCPVSEAVHGDAPVIGAARWGKTHLVEMMLPEGFDLEDGDRLHSRTLLHWAAWWGNCRLTEHLLELQADPFAEDVLAWTPIRAAFRGWVKFNADLPENHQGGAGLDHFGAAKLLLGQRRLKCTWQQTDFATFEDAMQSDIEINSGEPKYDKANVLQWAGEKSSQQTHITLNSACLFVDFPPAFLEVCQLLRFIAGIKQAPLSHLKRIEFRRQCEDCDSPEDLGREIGKLLSITPDVAEIDFSIFRQSKKHKSLDGTLVGMAQGIKQPPNNLRVVIFSGNLRLCKGFGSALAHFLNAALCVQVVDVVNCTLSAGILKEISSNLKPGHPGLRAIRKLSVIQDWQKHPDAGMHIAHILDKAPQFEKLQLSRATANCSLLKAILSGLQSPHQGLKFLHFNANPDLGKDANAGAILAGFLNVAPNLTKLKMGASGVTVDTIDSIICNMKAPHENLGRLVLSGNKKLPLGGGIHSLMKFLKLIPQVTALELSDCGLTAKSFDFLQEGLKVAALKLQILVLARNEGLFLEAGTAQSLAAILNDAPGLKTLDLRGSTFAAKHATAVGERLNPSPHEGLEELKLDIQLGASIVEKICRPGSKIHVGDSTCIIVR